MVKGFNLREFRAKLMEVGEPDTKGEIDLDNIAGTDKSQQLNPQQQQMQQRQAQAQQPKQKEPPPPKNLDAMDDAEIESDDDILGNLKGHPYVEAYSGEEQGKISPFSISRMDKGALVALKDKIGETITMREMDKKVGLYADRQYKLMVNLKNFIEAVLESK